MINIYFNMRVDEINKCFEKYKRGKIKSELRAEEREKRIYQRAQLHQEQSDKIAQRIQDKDSFANRMYALMKYKRVTQAQLAIALNVSKSIISMWSTGRYYPNEARRKTIIDFLTKPVLPVDPYDTPTPYVIKRVYINHLSARSPLGFRYASALNAELPEVVNENIKDADETVGIEIYKQFNN